MSIEISYILTIFNKQNYLADTIQSLRNQKGDFTYEVIFVDDCSADNSISVIVQESAGMENVKIIRNTDNKGPSIRLNQGVKEASGKYVYLLDGDDLIPRNSTLKMVELLKKETAEIIYGKHSYFSDNVESIKKTVIPDDEPYTVSNNPLDYIMKGGFVRMGLITTKELFMKSGGCDEQVFVQDESLPISLCSKAKKLIDYSATVLYMPAGKSDRGKVSSNEAQLHHDGFLAYSNALKTIRPMSNKVKNSLELKMISVCWKSVRITERNPYFTVFFFDYLKSKILKKAAPGALIRAANFFKHLPGVRRI